MSLGRLTWGAWRGTRPAVGVSAQGPRVLRAARTPRPRSIALSCKEPETASPRAEPSGVQLPQAPQHPHLWNKPAFTIRSWEPTQPSHPSVPPPPAAPMCPSTMGKPRAESSPLIVSDHDIPWLGSLI